MYLDSRSKLRLGWLAAALAPIVVVQVTRLATGSGPHHAAAASIQPSPLDTAAAGPIAQEAPLTEEQLLAIDWLAKQDAALEFRSPMNTPQPPIAVGTPQPAPLDDPGLPHLRLGGVVSRGTDVVASINGRLFTRGDEPADGWTIKAIDGPARVVTLQRFDGKRIELRSTGIVELSGTE